MVKKINKQRTFKDDARREYDDVKRVVRDVQHLATDSYGMLRDVAKESYDQVRSIPSRFKRLITTPSRPGRSSHMLHAPPGAPRRVTSLKHSKNQQVLGPEPHLTNNSTTKSHIEGKTPDSFKSRQVDTYVPAKDGEVLRTTQGDANLGDLKYLLNQKKTNHSGDGHVDVGWRNAMTSLLREEFKADSSDEKLHIVDKNGISVMLPISEVANILAVNNTFDDLSAGYSRIDRAPGIPAHTEHNTVIDRIKGDPGHVVYDTSFEDPRNVKQYLRSKYGSQPVPLLIGVEPNPGPKAKAKSRKQQPKARKMKPIMQAAAPAPVAMSYSHIQGHKNKKTVIKHCEQVAEINGVTATYPTTFDSANGWYSFHVNPGLAQTFPWLNLVASQYESYEFKKITFAFMPYSPSSTKGYVAMNFDYDPQDESSTELPNKQAFCDYDGAVQSNAWEATAFNVRCPNKEGPVLRENRAGTISGAYDLHNYDHGIFNMVVGGQADTSALGTLYVEYIVEFHRPRVSGLNTSSGFTHFNSGTGISASAFAGTSYLQVANNIPVTISGNVITVGRVGRYLLDYGLLGTTLVGAASCITAITGGAIVQNQTSIANAAATLLSSTNVCIVDIYSIGATITFAPITSGATFTSMSFYMAQIPTNLSSHKPTLACEDEVQSLKDDISTLMEKVKDIESSSKYVEAYYSTSSSSSSSAARTPALSSWDTLSRGSRK